MLNNVLSHDDVIADDAENLNTSNVPPEIEEFFQELAELPDSILQVILKSLVLRQRENYVLSHYFNAEDFYESDRERMFYLITDCILNGFDSKEESVMQVCKKIIKSQNY